MSTTPDFGRAALWYAKNGIPVFPVRPGDKRPLNPHGFKEATTDLAQVKRWSSQNPNANIGIPTGETSGWLVLDVDPRNGGEKTLAGLIAEHGPLPQTVVQNTGGGGLHYLFKHVQGVRCGVIGEGLDRKGDGGYIVVAPSVTSGLYSWIGGTAQLQEALQNLAEAPAWATHSTKPTAPATLPGGGCVAAGSRNATLTSLAGTMRRRGMNEESIAVALLEENKTRCEPPLSDSEVRAIAKSISRHEQSASAIEWPMPEPIQSELPPVEAFSEDLLPDSFRPLVRDVAERMQVPMDYPAVVMVLCLAGAVNRRVMIQPKEKDTGWVEPANLWGAIVGPPGVMKTPVIQAITRPLLQIQTEWRQEHEQQLAEYERAIEESDLTKSAWKDQFKASRKSGSAAPERPPEPPDKPKLRRLIVNDATFEALHQTMSENSAGVLLLRDELAGWLAGLERAGHEPERAFCLEAWNGKNPFTMDRIGRGTIHVPACCMSLFGGIQPGRLRSYMADTLRDGPSNDGLMQRDSVIVWPDLNSWAYVDRGPNAAAEEQAACVFRKLVELDAEKPARFCFAPDAQELFVEWLTDLEAKIRGDELHPALCSHFSKYRKLMPVLALLFELADRASLEGFDGTSLANSQNFVSLEQAKKAAAWCEYLESHAQRVYSCVVNPQLRAARELADKIKKRKLGAVFSCRDVYLKGWSGLDTPETVKQAVEILRDAAWVREAPTAEEKPFGGRPSDRYEINPGVWE